MALETVQAALAELGHTSRHALDVVERIATNQRPAARLFVLPVGESCSLVRAGDVENGAIAIDKPMRDAIDAPSPIEIGNAGPFSILISELDLKNRSCKFSLREDEREEDSEPRLNGEITDPMVHVPNNAYSVALANQSWLTVTAKPQLKEGEIEKLYILDASLPPPQLAAV